jgi:CubicO group peptidase (beta-lactamase class C family)
VGVKGSWRRRLAWVGATTTLLGGVWVWFFYSVATPRLGSQSELEGLSAPPGRDWSEPSNVDSLLSALATAFLERPANAGISIGITRNGQRHVVSRGVRSKSDPTLLVDDSTMFELGSLTKAFTGVALAQAVLDGHISLEQSIGELLPPSIAFPDPVRSIPVGALATHSAGLPSDPPSVSFVSRTFRENPFGRVTDRQAFESLAKVEVPEVVGRQYSYSNFGFMLLGRLLEEATGVSYARLIEEGVAGSLGMTSTWVEPPESELPHLAVGHRVGNPVEHWYAVPLPGASGIVSSVPDMLTLLEAHLHPDATPLSQPLRSAMVPRLRPSEAVEVALGWHVYSGPDVPRILYHNGSMMGFRSYMGMAPELGLGIVVLGNSRDPTISSIGRLIMRTLAGIAE